MILGIKIISFPDDHAREISLMALAILSTVQGYTIRHKPDYQLQIRIGIHTGKLESNEDVKEYRNITFL